MNVLRGKTDDDGESALHMGSSVRFTVDGEARTGTVAGFYRREPDPLVVVRLDDRTLKVPLSEVELLVAPRFAPNLIDKASNADGADRERFAMLSLLHSVGEQALQELGKRDTHPDNTLRNDLHRVVEQTRLEIEAAIEAANTRPSESV